MQNVGKDMIQPKLSYIAGGSVKGTITLENSLEVSYNICLHRFYHIINQQFQSQVFTLENKNLDRSAFFRKPKGIVSQQTAALDHVPCGLSDLTPSMFFPFPTSDTLKLRPCKRKLQLLHLIS